MKFIKDALAGLAFAGILAMMPPAAFAHGGGGQGGRGGVHAFVRGGHAFGGFTGRGLNPGFRGTRRFSSGQFAWPAYWSPYYSYDPSYLDDGSDNDDQDGDNSAPSVQPEPFTPAADHGPVVVSINPGNSGPMDSRANTEYINNGYSSSAPAGQPRTVTQDPNQKIGLPADPRTFVPPAVPAPAPTAAKGAQTKPPKPIGAFGNLVLVSWLEDAGKDVIYVQNTQTNEVQKITSEPNLDHFRIVELHPNADPKLSEAVISNGVQQGPVRFRF
jgi:hypothetical protein